MLHIRQDNRCRVRAATPERSQPDFAGFAFARGSSLGYQFASIIAGGPAPLIATWLYGSFHSAFAIAIYIAICAVITLVATALMTTTPARTSPGNIHRGDFKFPAPR
jgi:hypothetical protein